MKKSDKQKATVKADRSVLRRHIIAYEAKRTVHLEDILKHELLTVPLPLSLADTDGSLRTEQKSSLMEELCKKINTTQAFDVPNDVTLIIDGQALVMVLGNTQKHLCTSF